MRQSDINALIRYIDYSPKMTLFPNLISSVYILQCVEIQISLV